MFKAGSNASLTCISGLEDSRDIQVKFTFVSTKDGKQRLGSCVPNQTYTTHEQRWMIFRKPYPPYDCVLQIINATIADAGEYQCIGLLPTNISGQYWGAPSNTSELEWLTSAQAMENRSLTLHQYFVISLCTLLSVLGLLITVLIVVCAVYVYCRLRVADPERAPLLVSGEVEERGGGRRGGRGQGRNEGGAGGRGGDEGGGGREEGGDGGGGGRGEGEGGGGREEGGDGGGGGRGGDEGGGGREGRDEAGGGGREGGGDGGEGRGGEGGEREGGGEGGGVGEGGGRGGDEGGQRGRGGDEGAPQNRRDTGLIGSGSETSSAASVRRNRRDTGLKSSGSETSSTASTPQNRRDTGVKSGGSETSSTASTPQNRRDTGLKSSSNSSSSMSPTTGPKCNASDKALPQ